MVACLHYEWHDDDWSAQAAGNPKAGKEWDRPSQPYSQLQLGYLSVHYLKTQRHCII
jgi:hypothetical protein